MGYIETLRQRPDMVSPGVSACQGCGGELVLRRVLQIAGPDTIVCVPPGCMAGSGAIGWSHDTGMKVPVHIPLLDNTASFLSGLSHIYERRGRGEVNIVAVAGDGATADCGFQSLSGAAERGEKMLYVCYDNEGYMNTGYQRSSTTTEGSRTSTTPLGSAISGKQQAQKYVPLILAMHGVEYCATATPWNMRDMVEKIEDTIMTEFQRILDSVSDEELSRSLLPLFSRIYAYLAENADLCAAFLGENGDITFLERLKGLVHDKCFQTWEKKYEHIDARQFEYFYAFIISGHIGLIQTWLDTGMKESPEEIAALAAELSLHGGQFLE